MTSYKNNLKLFVVIATKNRVEYLERAIKSVFEQNYRNFSLVVSSDSDDINYEKEKKLAKKFGFNLLRNNNQRNYAGNLNNAINWILKKEINKFLNNIHDYYIAFLDDDDFWNKNYLLNCCKVLINKKFDLIISPLTFKTDIDKKVLAIPKIINYRDFLITNPNIQGSNTFIKLETLLKAGAFDENLSATTDRDFMLRVFMLNPSYYILDRSYVEIDASNNRQRITNNSNLKKESFLYFYKKYGSSMSSEERNEYLKRANMFCDLSIEELEYINNEPKNINSNNLKNYSATEEKTIEYKQRLLIAFTASSNENLIRLIQSIENNVKYKNKKIIVVKNFDDNFCKSDATFKCDYEIIDNNKIQSLINQNDLLKNIYTYKNNKRDIVESRTLLNYICYLNSCDGDRIWIIDDDMEFIDNFNNPIDVSSIFHNCDNYDVVVASYWYEPPVPLLSILRTELVDYMYKICFNMDSNHLDLSDNRDYFYDLSTISNINLETPQKIENSSINLDDIFNHNIITRPLKFRNTLKKFDPYSRGGNVFVFNRNVLLVPVVSIKYSNLQARRGDFFWIKLLENYNFKIVGIDWQIKHNRGHIKFDYKQEETKFLQDLIGFGLTTSYSNFENYNNEENKIINMFQSNVLSRFTKFISNYFRVIGILNILNDKKYVHFFTLDSLRSLNEKVNSYLKRIEIKTALRYLNKKIKNTRNVLKYNDCRILLENKINTKLKLLGIGNEGIVFNDNEFVYKIYTQTNNYPNIIKNISLINNIPELFEKTSILNVDDYLVIKYKFHHFTKYEGGCLKDIIEILQILKNNNLILKNIKKDNFIIVNNKLRIVDFNFEEWNISNYKKSIERFYQMLKYDVDDYQFNKLIVEVYEGDFSSLNGINLFYSIINRKTAYEEHDKKIIEYCKNLNPRNLIDYGCGKCGIANTLSKYTNVDVFDIDIKTMQSKSNGKLKINHDVQQIKNEFDIVNSNLVLCVVDDSEVDFILKQFDRLLNDKGKLILSICNPYFDNIENTIERTKGNNGNYFINSAFIKKTKYIERYEWHRPFEWYEEKLRNINIKINFIDYDVGCDLDDFGLISERIILVCERAKQNNVINYCEIPPIVVWIDLNINSLKTILTIIEFIKIQTVQHFGLILINSSSSKLVKSFIKTNIKYNPSIKDKIIEWYIDEDNKSNKINDIKHIRDNNNSIYIEIDDLACLDIYNKNFIENILLKRMTKQRRKKWK